MTELTGAVKNFDYDNLDREIKRTMRRSAKDVVQIGFMLRRMLEERLYLSMYADFDSYLHSELHIDYTAATRFIKLNKKYSLFGNSMELSEKYEDYSQSLLIEMLNMPQELEEKVTPDMTVSQVRKIKRQAKEEEQPVPEKEEDIIEGEYQEIKEPEKVATSQLPKLIKPDDKQREYLNAFARYFISCKHDWLIEDYSNRVLDVTKSPDEIKAHLDANNRTWYFTVFENKTAHINLFEEYIQLWDEEGSFIGDLEWFYLAAAIQSMWNIVAMENPREQVETLPCDNCAYDKNGCCDYNTTDDYCVEGNKWIPAENVEEIPTDDLTVVKHILEEQKKLLNDYLEVGGLPEMAVLKQKIMVAALASMVTELENMDSEPEESEQPELPLLKNNEQRKYWLMKYKDWGLWYRDERLDVNYYKYDFEDGSRLVVTEYPQRHSYWRDDVLDEYYYHLLEKNKKGYKNVYDEAYRHSPDSETYLVDFLKNLQKKE